MLSAYLHKYMPKYTQTYVNVYNNNNNSNNNNFIEVIVLSKRFGWGVYVKMCSIGTWECRPEISGAEIHLKVACV